MSEDGGAIFLAEDGSATAPSGHPTMAFEAGVRDRLHLLGANDLHTSVCGLTGDWLIPFLPPQGPRFCEACIHAVTGISVTDHVPDPRAAEGPVGPSPSP